LAISNLLAANDIDIAAITEVEQRADSTEFAVDGYVTFSPLVRPGAKTRVLVLVGRDSEVT
jgi:hypothetical protein